MGVRGLGDRQEKERKMTSGKIVSLLEVSPFTFEQLWRVSRIHRNTLKKRLECLVNVGVVFTHKFSIPYTEEFYGYMYKYPVANPYTPPLYGHTYYLLNCSSEASKGLTNFYYNNKAKEKIMPTEDLVLKENSKQHRKLSIWDGRIRELQERLLPYLSKKIEIRNGSEYYEYWRKQIEWSIFAHRLLQERNLTAVKIGYRYPSRPANERQQNELVKLVQFLKKRGCSLSDVLIRCSVENTILYTTRYMEDNLEADLMPYALLWNVMDEAGLIKDLNTIK